MSLSSRCSFTSSIAMEMYQEMTNQCFLPHGTIMERELQAEVNKINYKKDQEFAKNHGLDKKCENCRVDKFTFCEDNCNIKCSKTNICSTKDLSKLLYQEEFDENLRGELHVFAGQGNVDAAIKILQKGADVHGKTLGGRPPMYFAIENNCPHFVQLLIDWGCDVNELIPCYQLKRDIPMLHLAVYLNKPRVVQQLLHSGAEVNLCDSKSYTALHLASRNESADIARLLLVHGARVTDFTHRGDTPLMISVRYHSVQVFYSLVKYGADINECNLKTRTTAIHIAAKVIDIPIINYILLSKKGINAFDKYRYTPLHYAVVASCKSKNNKKCCSIQESQSNATDITCPNIDQINIVAELLRNGAKVDIKNRNEQTPLHLVTENIGCEHLIQVLIDNGADVNARNQNGDTPLNCLIMQIIQTDENERCFNVPESQFNDKNVIETCPTFKLINIVVKLIKHGTMINLRNKFKQTTLHVTYNGCNHLIQLLLDNGADITALDADGLTPLHNLLPYGYENNRKCYLGSQSIKKKIRESCPNVDSINMVIKFIERGTHINSKTNLGKTLLHFAVNGGCRHLVQVLINYGADINAVDENGDTPLFEAVSSESCMYFCDSHVKKECPNIHHISVVAELIRQGAKVNWKNKYKEIPLHCALNYNFCQHLIQVLLSNGADINLQNERGFSALHTIIDMIIIFRNSKICLPKINKNDFKSCEYSVITITIIEFLKRGAKINLSDKYAQTPLLLALRNRSCLHVIQVLLDFGANVNSINHTNDKAPLDIASYNKSIETIKLLLYYKANYECLLTKTENYEIDNAEELMLMISYFRIAKQMADLPQQTCDDIPILVVDELKLWKFREDCIKELQKMKSKLLFENVTAYQFLRADKKSLAHLVSKHRARALLDMMPDIELQYPIYGLMIRKNWGIGRRYAPLFKKAVTLFGKALNQRLPIVPLQKIICYLDHDEIRTLIRTINEAA